MKVSVVIPCFNVESFIVECLKSLELQTYKDLEIICINDGSTDKTHFKLSKFQKQSSLNIKVIHQTNHGAPHARNVGVLNSSGFYVQFLDADDLLTPNKIKHQITMAKSHDFPDLIVGSYQRESMEGGLLKRREYLPSEEPEIWLKLMTTDLGNTCSNLFKRELFNKSIEWNEKLKSSQEYDLMFQILKHNKHIVFDPIINTTIRIRNSGSISTENLDQKWDRHVQLRINIYSYIKQNHPKILNTKHTQVLFDQIRQLFPHNPLKAQEFYSLFIPAHFKPSASASTGKLYIILFNMFGFRKAELLRLSLKKI